MLVGKLGRSKQRPYEPLFGFGLCGEQRPCGPLLELGLRGGEGVFCVAEEGAEGADYEAQQDEDYAEGDTTMVDAT